jgi:hypothetical protein
MELEDATNTSCFLQIQNGSDIAAIRNKATGKYEISFTTTETVDSLTVGLYYGAEITENNAKVKLMIRLASDTDNTYVPYAKTNKQITDVIPSDASASNKLVTESDIATKQDKTDNSLATTSKTVVGAINELENNLTNIGDIYSASSPASISVPNDTPTNLVNLTLNKGVYIVYGYILEPPSMNKTYMCMLSSVSGSMSIYTGSEVAPAAGGWYASRTISSIVKVTANNSVIAVRVHQSSGSDCTYRGAHIYAVKISNYTD